MSPKIYEEPLVTHVAIIVLFFILGVLGLYLSYSKSRFLGPNPDANAPRWRREWAKSGRFAAWLSIALCLYYVLLMRCR